MELKEQINNILKKAGIKLSAEEVKLATETIGEGEATLEAEVFEPGQPVMIVNEEERIPLPVGEYQLDSGMLLVVVEEGVIAEMKEPQAEAEQPAQEEQAMNDTAEETPALPKKVVESVSKESYFLEEMPESVVKAIADVVEMSIDKKLTELGLINKEEVKEEVVEMAEEVKPIKHNPENKVERKVKLSKSTKTSVRDRVIETINKYK